jgi:hypothetical protein
MITAGNRCPGQDAMGSMPRSVPGPAVLSLDGQEVVLA